MNAASNRSELTEGDEAIPARIAKPLKRVTRALGDGVEAVSDNAREAVDTISQTAIGFWEEVTDDVSELTGEATDVAREWIVQNPFRAVLSAAAAGAVAALLLRR